jgi:brefeldin A-inhibited guanine nucleotide-exchange protein
VLCFFYPKECGLGLLRFDPNKPIGRKKDMESFLFKTLTKVKKEAPRRCKELRDYCDETLPQLGDRDNKDDEEEDADKYFFPFKLCCDSQYPRLMEIGLDAIHCLIEYGYLKGKTVMEAATENNNENSKRTMMDLIIETVSKCSDITDDGVQLKVIKALLIAVTSVYCEVHESSLLLAVRACFHIHLVTKNQVNKTTARAALTQMLSVVQQRMENYEIKMSSKDENVVEVSAIIPENVADSDILVEGEGGDGNDKTSDKDMTFVSIYHKDTFLLFRALCKLSMKGLHDDSGSQSDPIALQNKLLSLELILHMLNHSGPAFRSGDRFVHAIRNYLCVSLLGNCTSQVTQITTLSLQIFVALMDGFKKHLKNELEVFVTNIFLRILESENSTFDHKLRVLEVFYNICNEPSSLIEIFINYDCDFESIDLFRRIVDGFSKIAKNPSLAASKSQLDFMTSNGKRTLLEEQTIRMKGLEGLVTILKSLIKAGSFQQASDDSTVNATVTRGHRSSTNILISPSKNSINDDDSNELDNIAIDPVASTSANDDDENKVTKIVEVFDRKQKIQEEIENGILKFNINSKKGLAYLSSLGHVEMTPKSVANFLHQYQERLDKTAVGEYLGREREYENGFCLKVLYEYVDSMDFSGMLFDLAIRHFLAGFRLPGESQKIDRLMEKFAERYYLQNRDTFASADMAFILAFSTIMLQTNLHNPAIREDKRMTKEQFIKQNKGISSDGELSDELLSDIYDRIAAEPISITQDDKLLRKLKKDEQQAFLVFQTSTDKKRKDAFNNERKEMVKASEAMFKLKQRRDSSMRTSAPGSHEAYIRPMFDIVWAPITGVFSQIFETYDDVEMISLALEGFQAAVQLACRLDFPTARHTYINALTKFTTLDTIKEMQPKNVECIKIILDIALSDGEYLDESWSQVLHCISQVSRLQLFASGFHTDDLFFSNESNRNNSNSNEGSSSMKRRSSVNALKKDNNVLDPFTKLFSGPSKAETFRLIEEANAELLSKNINGSLIDRVFVNSENLSPESVCHFVKCLCEVSMVEITGVGRETLNKGDDNMNSRPFTPRIFSLQKLVEVADFNMYSRSRIAWNHIWGLLNFHFTAVGVNDNHALAMYAIDSLKQLSIKFLQKDELSNFNFQRVFLKPFEIIISKSKSPQIRDLVLRCIDIMIKACASNIRSGWRSIFSIFEVAATQEVQEIASIAFEIIERLLETQFDLLIYDFVELMNCLVAFSAGGHSVLSLKALDHLATCADKLASGAVNSALPVVAGVPSSPLSAKHMEAGNVQSSDGAATEASIEISQDASVFRIWWPLLLGLSTRVGDARLQVRFKALETLTFVLRKYGNSFSPQTWAMIFKGVLFPIVDSAKTDFTQQPESSFPTENPTASTNKQSWIGTMGQPVLTACIDLHQLYKEKSEVVNLLPDMFTMLGGCICQDTESLARMGLSSLSKLILSFKEGNNENCKPLVLPVATSELVCTRLASFLLQNICMDFEDVGQIDLVEGTPANIKALLADCPLNRRRKNKLEDGDSTRDSVSSTKTNTRASVSAINVGAVVKTMYGEGKLVAVAGGKRTIQLPWGLLYSFDNTVSVVTNAASSPTRSDSLGGLSMTPRLTSEQAWRQFTKSAMTSMVISLDFIEVLSNILSFHCVSFSSKHVTTLLDSLEAFYWQARSFNDNYRLRYKLRQKGFMIFLGNNNMLPHLIEQEVNSISRIIDILLKIYLRNNGKEYNDSMLVVTANRLEKPLAEFDGYIEESMRRLSMVVLNRYIDLDKISPSSMSDRFFIDQLEAYVPAVNIVLHGIFCFSPAQFQRNCTAILPLLSKLIVCSDRNIRLFIKNIFEKQIHPVVFSAGSTA